LLVDDHPVVRSGYHRLLEQDGAIAVVAEAGDVETAYRLFGEFAPDVCVTDLSLPGIGGIELLRKILSRDRDARVLVFSMHDSAVVVRRALEAGARGFVSKSAAPEVLVNAVQEVHAGRRYLSSDLSHGLLERTANDEANRLASLTQREFEIFRLIAAGLAAGECAAALNLSAKTIANNQTVIKEKLGVTTSAALVHLALRNGIIDSAA
jgi:DNA-binding NarL/FixJ family response regulator